jgi:hypothetical protein
MANEAAGSLSTKKTEVPTFDELMGPTVGARKRLEGSASITVMNLEKLPRILSLRAGNLRGQD